MKIVLDRKEEPMLYATVFSLKLFFFFLALSKPAELFGNFMVKMQF